MVVLSQQSEKSLSKLLSLILRHSPEAFGVTLDPEDGSCSLDSLLEAVRAQSKWSAVQQEDIEQVVRNSDKQRFVIESRRIRARYGHSHDKVQYTPSEPPKVLYHGTNKEALPSIMSEGLRPMGRQYVHLSEGTHFAALAGSRRGELAILRVDTMNARQRGIEFYFAGNEVWLADHVPPDCCSVANEQQKEDI